MKYTLAANKNYKLLPLIYYTLLQSKYFINHCLKIII